MAALIGCALLFTGGLATPARAVLCNFDDAADPLCQTALDATWQGTVNGQPNRRNDVFLSPAYSFYNNFGGALGIQFNNVVDFDRFFIATTNIGAGGTLTITGFRNGVPAQGAQVVLMFSALRVFTEFIFPDAFNMVDRVDFVPDIGFPTPFGEFLVDDLRVQPVLASGVYEPMTGALLALGLTGLALARRRLVARA